MKACKRLMMAFVLLLAVGTILPLTDPARGDERIPADAQPRWWKGNLHTHSLWSDGDDFPEMIAEWYRTRDYHFLALTDHNVLSQGMRWMKAADIAKRGGDDVLKKYRERFGTTWVETRGAEVDGTLEVRLKPFDEFRSLAEERGKFLLIPAEEISDKAEGVPVHINASNLRDALQPVGGATVRETIENNLRAIDEQAVNAGREILAHLNHPNFGWAITAEDLAYVVTDRFFEVYNGHPGVNQQGDAKRPSIDRMWDIANTIRLAKLDAPPLFGIATDDSHAYHGKPNGARPGRGWLMVRATHLTPETIIRAIKAGDCYASSGVTLSLVRYDAAKKTLELAIEPSAGATYQTHFIGTLRGYDETSQPVLGEDGQPLKDKNGQPARTSQRYSDEVGRVLRVVEGLKPRYELTGEELYVRAVVISSQPPADPSFEGQKAQAWTQPVGWEWLKSGAASGER